MNHLGWDEVTPPLLVLPLDQLDVINIVRGRWPEGIDHDTDKLDAVGFARGHGRTERHFAARIRLPLVRAARGHLPLPDIAMDEGIVAALLLYRLLGDTLFEDILK